MHPGHQPPPQGPYGQPSYPPSGYPPPGGYPPPAPQGYPPPVHQPGPAQPPAGYPPPAPPGYPQGQPGYPPGQPPGPTGPPGGAPQQFQNWGHPGGADEPLILDIGRTAARQATIGAVVSGAVGLIAIVAGLGGDVDGGGEAAAIVIGGLFLLPVALVLVFSKQIFRPRKLVIEPGGVRWDDPSGTPWAVGWNELGAVSISKHSAMPTPQSANDRIVGAATDKMLGERAHVRLDLYPADAHFQHRHPEMAHLWQRQGVSNGYRLPLGNQAQLVSVVEPALVRFAPGIYRGVVATEGVMGLS